MGVELIVKPFMFAFYSLFVLSCSFQGDDEDADKNARQRMVKENIQGRGIDDEKIHDAMVRVQRHLFVPEDYQHLAYEDRPLPIGEGQTISQPYIVALMTSHLHIQSVHKVLEIGTGSGYQAAILAKLAKEVYSVEIIDTLATKARERLQRMGYTNVWVKCSDGFFGWEEYSPYDAIIITCASPKAPDHLIEQLAEGGRMVLPLGDDPFYQDLLVLTKREGAIKSKRITGVVFVPMRGEIEHER